MPYKADDIKIEHGFVEIGGRKRPIAVSLRAAVPRVLPPARIAALALFGLAGPILGMVLLVQAGGLKLEFGFGPVIFALAVACGLVACGIGVAWKRGWGLLAERRDVMGYELLAKMADEAEARKAAEKLQAAIK